MSEHHQERLIGLRNGELFALEWNAVNLDEGVLVVRWQLQELRGLKLKEPKTTAGKESRRSILSPLKRLGHQDFATTANIYSHLLQGVQDEAVSKVAAIMLKRAPNVKTE